MKIGILGAVACSQSVRIYRGNVVSMLREAGVKFRECAPHAPLPNDVDLYWDPTATAGRPPDPVFDERNKPLAVTVHGMAACSVPAREYFPDIASAIRSRVWRIRNRSRWRRQDTESVSIITVSRFAKAEIERCLPIAGIPVTPIHHGVDHGTFYPSAQENSGRPYLLHVSSYQPVKNIDRILEAYRTSNIAEKVDLVLVAPGVPTRLTDRWPGVRWISAVVPQHRLAILYREAVGFVFPSLRESFGMPILEAMASGCPVITSRGSACQEVAAGAALLVNPRSVDEIRDALRVLTEDGDRRARLSTQGLARARQFTWDKCAQEHIDVFEKAIQRTGR